jgi:hypothetical protein
LCPQEGFAGGSASLHIFIVKELGYPHNIRSLQNGEDELAEYWLGLMFSEGCLLPEATGWK